jgi:hypothetical protein
MRGEYEATRLDGRRFLVCRGHGVDEIEFPLVTSDRYQIVQTIGDAAAAAEALSPRRSTPPAD